MNTLAFETGVSDHRKLIGAMLRSTFAEGKNKFQKLCDIFKRTQKHISKITFLKFNSNN